MGELYQRIRNMKDIIVAPHDRIERLAQVLVVSTVVFLGYSVYSFTNELIRRQRALDELVLNDTRYRLVEHSHVSDLTQPSGALPCLVLEVGYQGSQDDYHHTFQNPSESRDITFTLKDGPKFLIKDEKIATVEPQR